jgi:mRNA interferase RelE/StbE
MYQVFIERKVIKFLQKIHEPTYSKLKSSILNLSLDPRPPGCKKLKGRLAYRIRQGDYRIIYEIQDKVLKVNIITIGHRSDVYGS